MSAPRVRSVRYVLYEVGHMTQEELNGYIKEMVQRIVSKCHPEKVILFGSHARGEAGRDSDVDLLVVIPVAGSKRAVRVEMRRLLNDIPVSKDIVVTTPEEFQWRQKYVGTIERPALREGKILYAQGTVTDLDEAKEAVYTAEAVRKTVRRILPSGALN